MPGFDGSGPNGIGPMTGGARGFCAVPILPGRSFYPYSYYGSYASREPTTWMSREQEFDYLRQQTEILKNDLNRFESEINRLSNEKK